MELVGRGIYLSPDKPYELKAAFFEQQNKWSYYSKETEQVYSVVEGYGVNDSPPMPANQALNKVVIEESWEHLDKQMGLDASVALGNGLFNVDASSNRTEQVRCKEDAYYAVRSSFIPLWSVYLPDITGFSEEIFTIDVPVPFKHRHRNEYEKFFERYGTHYVKRVWVGGKAMLVYTIVKSSNMKKEDIQAGIKASSVGLGDCSMNATLKKDKEKLQNNSECTVFGAGGDQSKLAALSSLDGDSYNEWLATVKDNPQAIELEVAGIWTLASDPEKAKALRDAYQAATAFAPISAVFNIDGLVYFLRGNKYVCYDTKEGATKKPQALADKWNFLSQHGFDRIDAAFKVDNLPSSSRKDLQKKLFLFKENRYIRVDIESNDIDEGYPKRIEEGWPGVTFDRIDAALDIGYDLVYFFQGDKYIRYDLSKNRVDDDEYGEYPALISKRWLGLVFDRIDAAIYWGNGKVYFFREDQHIRYDMVTCHADPGYPKSIIGGYVEDWKFFDYKD